MRRWSRHLAGERLEASVYRELAARRTREDRDISLALAEAEGRHAAHWERLGEHGGRAGRPSLRSVVLALLARWFGSVFVLALAQRAEVVRGLAERGREQVSGTFRAAVFGVNDGLVSNLALVVGMAASGAPRTTVLLTGLAGLLSGAMSMGAGEYISVRSQRELLAAPTMGSGHVAAYPHVDVDGNELALVYRARGMSAEQAQQHAREQLAAGPAAAEAGVAAPHDVVGSDVGAGLSSFVFFASGAAVPVLPFLLGLSEAAAPWSPCCWWPARCC